MTYGLWALQTQPYLFTSHLSIYFQVNVKKYLLVSVPLWIKHVSDEQIQGFVENLMVAIFKGASPPGSPELRPSALQGLSLAMKLPSPSHHLWTLLCDTAGKIFDLLPNKIQVRKNNIYVPNNLCLGCLKVILAIGLGNVLRIWVGSQQEITTFFTRSVWFQDLKWNWIFKAKVLINIRGRLTSAAPGNSLCDLSAGCLSKMNKQGNLYPGNTGNVVLCTVSIKCSHVSPPPHWTSALEFHKG